jgi:hypothetical protein
LKRFDVCHAAPYGRGPGTALFLVIASDDFCGSSPHALAVPIRTKPPGFKTLGLVDVRRDLRDVGSVSGFIRCDLPLIFKSIDMMEPITHHFGHSEDILRIESALKEVFGL